MKREELKQLIRPLVKECVKESVQEILLESGLLAQVIGEVVKGFSPVIKEEKATEEKSRYVEVLKKSEKEKLNETRRQLVDSLGKTSYNGVNVFKNIKETIPEEVSSSPVNLMQGIAPHDPGVDISNLFDFNKANILAKGKKT